MIFSELPSEKSLPDLIKFVFFK